MLLLLLLAAYQGRAQEQRTGLELYGYVKADVGYNFHQSDPDWFDVLRVTKLPRFKDQFAPDGKIYFSVRQTRLGLNSWSQTSWGQLKANFEFDLFGVGPDVGQTTFRFRKAYVTLGGFTVGQTESLFSDTDVTPNTLDFGAPPSRTFLRPIQVNYTQASPQHRWGIALEQPGAISDEGIYASRIELQNVRAEFKLPDLALEYRKITGKGYVELAAALKWIRWEDTGNNPIDLTGQETGWGFNLSANQPLDSKTLFRGQFVYGKGIENHLTDAGPDIGIENNLANPTRPVLGAALPVIGGLAFVECSWNNTWSSTLGYSRVRIYNSDAQAGDAFKTGHYAIVNVLCQPFVNSLAGAELQWGKRENFNDGFSSSALRMQFSFKYSFSHSLHEKTIE